MNIDSPHLNSLFSSRESLATGQQSPEVEGMSSQYFTDALKELAGQLNKKGVVAAVDIAHTIDAPENVWNSLEYVATDELNLEARLQDLIEKTEALKVETLDAAAGNSDS